MANYAKVNYIQHLLFISERFISDTRLTPWHISLYYSIFQYWNLSKFQNPLSISRTELMQASKIGSVNTYIKCLKELDYWGYLKYNPSYNPQKGSQVYLYSLDKATDTSTNKGSDKASDKTSDKATHKTTAKGANNGTDNAAVMPVIPYINNNINNINSRNILNERKRENKKKLNKNSPSNSKSDEKFQKKSPSKSKTPLPEKRKKIAEKKVEFPGAAGNEIPSDSLGLGAQAEIQCQQPKLAEASSPVPLSHGEGRGVARPPRPLLLEVQNFFKEKSWPALEAEKYFNHYQSNGWLVAGKTPMVDWQASAAKWMLNAKDFKSGQPPSPLKKGGGMRLQTTTRSLSAVEGKNYNEPL